eukprot:Unigene17185_Nuclearia_a/m.50460 Unigene17185_Nuclearia_a/g.50460  ORF Unigene17185_Nuclearia_a/g.50460 Unigene17185_Nuclearia_a/m.50460 type:complete len:419 (+) Unigene17185_Nuclearia_a:97-1353(+)
MVWERLERADCARHVLPVCDAACECRELGHERPDVARRLARGEVARELRQRALEHGGVGSVTAHGEAQHLGDPGHVGALVRVVEQPRDETRRQRRHRRRAQQLQDRRAVAHGRERRDEHASRARRDAAVAARERKQPVARASAWPCTEQLRHERPAVRGGHDAEQAGGAPGRDEPVGERHQYRLLLVRRERRQQAAYDALRHVAAVRKQDEVQPQHPALVRLGRVLLRRQLELREMDPPRAVAREHRLVEAYDTPDRVGLLGEALRCSRIKHQRVRQLREAGAVARAALAHDVPQVEPGKVPVAHAQRCAHELAQERLVERVDGPRAERVHQVLHDLAPPAVVQQRDGRVGVALVPELDEQAHDAGRGARRTSRREAVERPVEHSPRRAHVGLERALERVGDAANVAAAGVCVHEREE